MGSEGNNMRTVSQIMNKLEKHGYKGNFAVVENQLVNYDNHKKYNFDEVQLDYEFRAEGESNPDDETLLFALKTKDGAKGVVVADYGATGNTDTIAFVNQVDKTDQKDPKML